MIVTLTGQNSLQLEQELKKLSNNFIKQHGEIAIERVDCEEVEYTQITEAIQSLPFLSDKKLVILNRPGTQKQFVENLDKLLESISDSTAVIIVEPKPDKRSSYYKLLQKKTDFKLFDEPSPRELPLWLVDQAKARGGAISRNDAQYLIDRVGSNQQLLSSELDKLILHRPDVTRQTIDALTDPSPQSTIFQLLEAAFSGNIKRTLELYNEQRALKVEPAQIIAMIAWQLQAVAVVKTAGDKPVQVIAADSGLSPFVIQKSQAIAKRLTLQQVRRMVHDLYELDVKTKSISIDPDDALQHYLLTLSL